MKAFAFCLLFWCQPEPADVFIFDTQPSPELFSLALGLRAKKPHCPPTTHSVSLRWTEHNPDGIEPGEINLPCLPVALFENASCRCERESESICVYRNGKLYSGWPAGKCPEVKPCKPEPGLKILSCYDKVTGEEICCEVTP